MRIVMPVYGIEYKNIGTRAGMQPRVRGNVILSPAPTNNASTACARIRILHNGVRVRNAPTKCRPDFLCVTPEGTEIPIIRNARNICHLAEFYSAYCCCGVEHELGVDVNGNRREPEE
jgi:hypothetical protein